jgi:hypothetical protein
MVRLCACGWSEQRDGTAKPWRLAQKAKLLPAAQ